MARIEGEWVIPSRWHIDDVKLAIKGSEYEKEPMPSDEKLMDYLFEIVGSDAWVESMNEQLWMNLFELFDKDGYHKERTQNGTYDA